MNLTSIYPHFLAGLTPTGIALYHLATPANFGLMRMVMVLAVLGSSYQ